MKKFRSFVCVLAAVVFACISLAGCALFESDVKYDYAQIVAKMGNIEINKKQLIDGYNNFGYQYVSQQDMSLADAYDKTLNQLIDREIAVNESIRLFGPITENEKRQARKTSYDYVQNSFTSIAKELRERKSGVVEEEKKDEEKSDEIVKYNPFEKYIDYNKNENTFKLNLDKYKNPANAEAAYDNNQQFLDFLESKITADPTEAYNKLVRLLASNEKGVGQFYEHGKMTFRNVEYDNKNIEKDKQLKRATVEREILRVQFEEEKNILAKRLQETFDLGLGKKQYDFDYFKDLQRSNFAKFETEIQGANTERVTDVASRARADVLEKITDARNRYDWGFDDKSEYYTKLLEGLTDVYFVPEDVASQFFTVSHILLKYTDEQTAEIAKIKEDFAAGKFNAAVRDEKLEKVKQDLRVNPIINGEKSEQAKSAVDVLADVKRTVMPFDQGKNFTEKAVSFRDMIYMYNGDPGMQNPEFEYVIGRDTRVNGAGEDTMSKMVPEFTKASRELFNYNNSENRGGKMKAKDYAKQFKVDINTLVSSTAHENDLIDTRGTISDLVWTDYGAHIIMYTRNINDFVFTNTAPMINQSLDKYLHATFTGYGNKTYFDAAVERITRPDYSIFETSILDGVKSQNTITYYKSRYKNLTKVKK
jgi:hypothetical protein